MGNTQWFLQYCDIVSPKLEDILDCVSSDSLSYENARNFEDFCNEFGYDINSRKAEKIYQACAEQAKELLYRVRKL
jgi:hypothetical protein